VRERRFKDEFGRDTGLKKELPGIYKIGPVAAFVYFLDQLTKFWVRVTFRQGQRWDLLPFFSLNRVENTGAAFGIMTGQNLFFIVSSFAVLVLLVFAGRGLPENWKSWFGQGFVWGGALGNLTDRLINGHVTDFLDFFLKEHHWPSFNVADSAITVGAGLLLLCTFGDR
jgi:signal peptidase II